MYAYLTAKCDYLRPEMCLMFSVALSFTNLDVLTVMQVALKQKLSEVQGEDQGVFKPTCITEN